MKIFFKILLILIVFKTPSFAQEMFVTGFEDLPLMEGLEASGEELLFDTPAGKIIESHAYSESVSVSQVLDFYKSTLPQLGWVYDGNNSFSREGEKLLIETVIQEGVLDVKFFLQPNK